MHHPYHSRPSPPSFPSFPSFLSFIHVQPGRPRFPLALYSFLSALEHTCTPNLHSKPVPAALIELPDGNLGTLVPSLQPLSLFSIQYISYLISYIMPHATPYPFPQVNVICRNSTVHSIQNKPEARKLKFRDKARHGSSIRSMQQQIATEPVRSIGPALTAVGRECDWFWHGRANVQVEN